MKLLCELGGGFLKNANCFSTVCLFYFEDNHSQWWNQYRGMMRLSVEAPFNRGNSFLIAEATASKLGLIAIENLYELPFPGYANFVGVSNNRSKITDHNQVIFPIMTLSDERNYRIGVVVIAYPLKAVHSKSFLV